MGEKGNASAEDAAASIVDQATSTIGGLAGTAATKVTELGVEAGAGRVTSKKDGEGTQGHDDSGSTF